jgi:hypothetical protein
VTQDHTLFVVDPDNIVTFYCHIHHYGHRRHRINRLNNEEEEEEEERESNYIEAPINSYLNYHT